MYFKVTVYWGHILRVHHAILILDISMSSAERRATLS